MKRTNSAPAEPASSATVGELEAAYSRYGPALVRKAKRMLGTESDALDVVQQLFVQFMHKPPRSFDLPYLYVAINRQCLNRLRDAKVRHRLLDRNLDFFSETSRARLGMELEGRSVERQWLIQLVERLDEEDAEVLALCFVDGLRQQEAAQALDVSRRTVVKRLGRVRAVAAALRKEMSDE